ncbi:MAG: 16S rRNA (guanine(527)-N(7))-methyltransferase RsmG [Bacteroidetes bacterium]|nr:16S rRNA (guanine(527)-N(7))-methyltransferase RsmG [Bacteroidota bacterium]
MVSADIVFKYFPELDENSRHKILQLQPLYAHHNERVNMISRKDFDNFYLHHVLHSLALARVCPFQPGQSVIDIGTGGGFPGIPLAILFPKTQFTLCDSIGKKIRVVQEVIEVLELTNAQGVNSRTESLEQKFDIATARAVAPMSDLWKWMLGHWKNRACFFLLKGGDLDQEMKDLLTIQPKLKMLATPISSLFDEEFFETKKVIRIS